MAAVGTRLNSLPTLTATTNVSDVSSLLRLSGTDNSFFFKQQGRGLAGTGEVIRAEFSGPERFNDAEAWWLALCHRATVVDTVQRPGSGLAAFGAFTFADHSQQKSVLVVPEQIIGVDEAGAFETRIALKNPSTEAKVSHPLEASDSPARDGWNAQSISEGDFLSLVALAKDRITSGAIHKAVVARDLVRHLPQAFSPEGIVKKLSDAYPDTFVFSVDGLIGASPETLASVRGKNVQLRVLAGSAPRGVDGPDDLQRASSLATSVKDLDEHRFAVENVLQTLHRHGITAVADDVPFQLKLPNLWHLATDIRAVLPETTSSIRVIGALHPTAAVAGSPTDAALDFINTHENLDRGRYAGPVGWVDANGDGDWAIALRCAQIDTENHTITAYAGAGIVAESDPTTELLETELKFRPIIDAVNGALL